MVESERENVERCPSWNSANRNDMVPIDVSRLQLHKEYSNTTKASKKKLESMNEPPKYKHESNINSLTLYELM